MDAFDADALIYAAAPEHALGQRVVAFLTQTPVASRQPPAAVGSLLLLPELLAEPHREGTDGEVQRLVALLSRIDLRPLDDATADLAVALGAAYRLRAADSVHLATAVGAGADRFVTNNRRDFDQAIDEIDVTYLEDLPDLAAS